MLRKGVKTMDAPANRNTFLTTQYDVEINSDELDFETEYQKFEEFIDCGANQTNADSILNKSITMITISNGSNENVEVTKSIDQDVTKDSVFCDISQKTTQSPTALILINFIEPIT